MEMLKLLLSGSWEYILGGLGLIAAVITAYLQGGRNARLKDRAQRMEQNYDNERIRTQIDETVRDAANRGDSQRLYDTWTKPSSRRR